VTFKSRPGCETGLKTTPNRGYFSCQNYTLKHLIFSNALMPLSSKPDSSDLI
jgi:hypothetical protein